MKEVFQMLKDPRFHLVYGVTQRYSNGPEPRRVRLNREGYKLVEGVTKKALVYPRMRLAVHPSPLKGDAFSPIFGRITDVTERSLFVEAIEPDEALRALADGVEKVDLINDERTGQELAVLLKSLGLNTKSLGQQCETLIINGLNPDPGVTWAEPMLLTHQGTLRAGLAVLRRLSPAKRILLVKSVTGKEKPEGVGVVGLHNVWSLGRVARTGLPLIESVITLGSYTHSGNYIVKEGSMLGELLEFAHIKLNSGDTLVRGGPLRGESIDRLDRSITKGATGVFVVEAGTVPPMEGHSPCINCGACVLICPARLSPSMLSRNAEFALHERCRDEHVDCCLECGLCGYVCIARRPVLQYIRLAKHKLAQADEARRLKERELRPAAQPAAEAKEGEN